MTDIYDFPAAGKRAIKAHIGDIDVDQQKGQEQKAEGDSRSAARRNDW